MHFIPLIALAVVTPAVVSRPILSDTLAARDGGNVVAARAGVRSGGVSEILQKRDYDVT